MNLSEDSRAGSLKPGESGAEDGRPRRILLVDDEAPLVELLTLGLTERGYEVTGFSEPRQALAEFRSRPGDFDILVSDLSMPHLPGLALARQLREIRPGVLVVLSSGHVTLEQEEEARRVGALGIAQKGFSVEEISDVIDSLVRGCVRPGETR